jgi:ubiquinone/menaquinone biosynthesis C-methylase UbiE
MSTAELTQRQQREIDYHKGHAALQRVTPMKFDVLYSEKRRWWNAYWDVWTYLKALGLKGKRVLVVGCGAGDDAILFGELGAKVSAFDLSPDMIAIARARAALSNVEVDFAVMPSENLAYPDNTFDLVFACDILHHVDIPRTMDQLRRVSKNGALFVANEIYSHSVTEHIRRAGFVEKRVYPLVSKIIYRGQKPYITADERKMTEADIALVKRGLGAISRERYFNFLVTRIISNKSAMISRMDRLLLSVLGKSFGRIVAGRIVLIGEIS